MVEEVRGSVGWPESLAELTGDRGAREEIRGSLRRASARCQRGNIEEREAFPSA